MAELCSIFDAANRIKASADTPDDHLKVPIDCGHGPWYGIAIRAIVEPNTSQQLERIR